jgi:exopolyphosphatase/guanosine-5'-triphosphate,3'-diphosphate pyrophosphatase
MPTLLEESLALRARYDEEPSHSDQVANLALQIFDRLRKWSGLGDRPRELLHSAALLHDIGWSQTSDGKGHHKWSAKLIQEHEWKNLKRDEVAVVSQIARYHRKAIPQSDHAEFQALSAPSQKLVLLLGGMLRIADALDRTHTSRVVHIDVSVSAEALLFLISPNGPWDAERAMFENKRDMLELAAKRTVECEPQKRANSAQIPLSRRP